MPAFQALLHRSRRAALRILAVLAMLAASAPFARAQTDGAINQSVWQMLYGVPNGQIEMTQMMAGANPFLATTRFESQFSMAGANVSLTFPTVLGKTYKAQGSPSLNPVNFTDVAGTNVVGDGATHMVTFAKGANLYFHVVVSDQSTPGDQVSDWAKNILGYSPSVSINSQSQYNHTTLAAALATQNVVTVVATDASATQPPDNATPASDPGVITFNRSGYQLFSTITVPIVKTGTAIEGADFAALPGSVTFPAGVNSVALNVTPLYNATRLNSTTLTVTAQPGGGYTLGAQASASVTIYPSTVGGAANGTGLTGAYYNGSNVLYSNAQTLGASVSTTATYVFTQSSTTQGSVVVTYTGAPESPFTVGSVVSLSFTTGLLNTTAYGPSNTTNVFSSAPYSPYTISAVSAPGVYPATFTVPLSANGISLPANTNGNVTVTPFAGITHANNFGGIAVNYTFTKLTSTTGTAVISYAGTPAAAFSGGGSATLQFTAGNLFTGAPAVNGLYDRAYTISSTTGPATFAGATISIGSNALVTTLSPHGFVAGTQVTFTTTGALPTGLTASNGTSSTTYYVISAGLTSTAFEVSATPGGGAVTTSGTQSGTHTVQSATFTVPITAPAGVASLPATGTISNATLTPFNAPVVSRVDPTVNFYWGTGQPAITSLQIQSNQNWGARWDSWLAPSAADTYHFDVKATDGARVYVNNVLVIDGWALGSSSITPLTSDTLFPSGIALGTSPVPIRVEFYHLNAPTGSINLRWMGSSGSFAGIPAANTFLTNGGSINGWSGKYWTNVGANAPAPSTISSGVGISIAAPAVVTTSSAHGFISGTPVVFSTTGSLPTGLTAGSTYYVIAAGLTSTSFEVSDAFGGSPVATSGSQSGTPTVQSFTTFYGQPRYGDYPDAISNLAWSSQPSANVTAASHFSVRWDGYVKPIKNLTNSAAISIANPAVVTSNAHGLSAGSTVTFSTNGFLPGALTPGTTYYVIATGLTTNTFQISATSGGSAISTLGYTQSGTHTASVTGITDNYTFEAQASDGVRVYLDPTQSGTLSTIIDGWTADSSANAPGLDSTTYALTTGQQYHIRVEYYQTQNATVTANGLVNLRWKNTTTIPAMVAIPSANLFRADAFSGAATNTLGLWADYYNTAALTDPPLYSTQDTNATGVTYTYNTGVPAGGNAGTGGSNNWAGRITGYLKATANAGNYQFQLSSLSAGHLLVNGTEVIPFSPGTAVSGLVNLTANQVVPITVEFYNNGSNGQATVSWLTPGGSTTYAAIPIGNLFQDAGATVPGLVGTYWANTAFNGSPFFADYLTSPAYASFTYTGHTGTPGDSWATTAFSAYWDGYIPAATAGDYIFSLQAQNKARIIVNGSTVVDGWTVPGSTAATPVSGTINLPGGPNARVPIHIDFETSASATTAFLGVMWQPPTGSSLVTIPNTALFIDATSTLQGVTATYFANRTQTPPFLYQVAENNNPEWGTSSTTSIPPNATIYGTGTPDPSMTGSNFTVRWTGQVLAQYSEPYWFEVSSDDGARLYVNGQLILNKWQSQGNTKNVSNPIILTAGAFYDIKLEYLNISGSAEAHLYWYSADQPEQIIPMSRLYPAITGVANAGPSAVTSPVSDTYNLNSGAPYSYTIAGSNGATFSASGLPPGLTLNGAVISGTPAAGTYQFIVTTTTAAGSSSAVVNLTVSSAVGTITREIWNGLSTPNVIELQDKIANAVAASSTDTTLTSLEDNTTTYGANTGERLRGYITPSVSGNYYFWVASNGSAASANFNNAELWVSNTDQPTSNVLRATVSGTTNNAMRTWNAQSNQKSFWLALNGGTRYYFEVLHNTGSAGANNNLSVGWYLDPTGNTANPIANGAGPSANVNAAGVVPQFVLSPWDNPPAVTTSGTVYLASLAGSSASIKASGGAYISLSGSTGIVHINTSGLSSGMLTQQIFYISNAGVINPAVLFDLGAQDKNYSNLKTADGGYSWAMQPSDVTNLMSGNLVLVVGTTNHPVSGNPKGELFGKFSATPGGPTPPAIPSYPTWSDDHATNDASNSRFLTQATFGPSPTDMNGPTSVKTLGYKAWIENQFTTASSHHVPYALVRLNASPVTPYPDPLTANAWWLNSITAPDQLRQRVAFALSEILVTSTNGPLNNNDRSVSDYYDTLLDHAFTDFRTILKQISLTSAMGLYLNMQGNYKGNIVTGLHANENYGREIMQLFSIGLYRRWSDGTLVLDNSGNPIPTYTQTDITGVSQALTGWNYGQALSGGRLPTGGPNVNYLDPMVLLASQHELGAKNLPDNVVLPAAIVVSQSDTSRDPSPNPITVTSTSPTMGSGFTVQTPITSTYDVYALNDFEQALNVIMANGSAAPYLCRQLIQRLVTSNPKLDYIKRVVRAFNGQQNIGPDGTYATGTATGVVGDMKDVIRAILLDPEARSATSAADNGFGKQREPLLRITGPVRAFPTTALTCTYRQQGGQVMHFTAPSAHGLVSDTVFVDNFVDLTTGSFPVPSPTTLQVKDVTPSYTYVGATHIATINAPGYKAGTPVTIQFTGGVLNTAPYNTAITYPSIASATTVGTTGSFTVDISTGGGTPPVANQSTNSTTLTPNEFNFYMGGYISPGYTLSGTGNKTVTITASAPVSGCPYTVGQSIFLQFNSGSASGGTFDGVYSIATATASNFTVTLASSPPGSTSGTALIPYLTGGYTVTTVANNSSVTLNTGTTDVPLLVGDPLWINFSTTNGLFNSPIGPVNRSYNVAALPPAYGGYAVPNQFTINSPIVLTAGTPNTGSAYAAYPLTVTELIRNGTCKLEYGNPQMGITVGNLDQGPLYSTTVFNYFYPDYQFPGQIASLGMTTPEFQLTDATNTMNLTNNVSNGVLSPTPNANGLMFFSLSPGTVCMDLRAYLTLAQTQNSGIPALVATIGNLLTGGGLTPGTQSTISTYVQNNVTAPANSTDIANMSKRVRAIIHLIVTSSEYAIQK